MFNRKFFKFIFSLFGTDYVPNVPQGKTPPKLYGRSLHNRKKK